MLGKTKKTTTVACIEYICLYYYSCAQKLMNPTMKYTELFLVQNVVSL